MTENKICKEIEIIMAEKDSKKQVPTFTMDLRADDPLAIGTIKNRMRLLTLPGDREERDKLKAVKEEFEDWNAKGAEKK